MTEGVIKVKKTLTKGYHSDLNNKQNQEEEEERKKRRKKRYPDYKLKRKRKKGS